MTATNKQSEAKNIRFKKDLLAMIELARGDQSFSSWVQDACKVSAYADMSNRVDANKEKGCSKCKQIKPLTDFHSDSTHLSGRASKCKECTSIDDKARAAKKKAKKG